MSERPEPLVEALRPLVAELVDQELERRLDELDLRRARPTWLTLEEAADHYRTTAGALRWRAQHGRLPGAVKDGSRWLVNVREFDEALTSATLPADNRITSQEGRAPRKRPRPGTRR
jgi:hypothetical protein